jgi:hypothetical protein
MIYDIMQLNEMLVTDLQSIAENLQVKNVKKLEKIDLVYKILDAQALLPINDAEVDAKKAKPAKVVKEKVAKPIVAKASVTLDAKKIKATDEANIKVSIAPTETKKPIAKPENKPAIKKAKPVINIIAATENITQNVVKPIDEAKPLADFNFNQLKTDTVVNTNKVNVDNTNKINTAHRNQTPITKTDNAEQATTNNKPDIYVKKDNPNQKIVLVFALH